MNLALVIVILVLFCLSSVSAAKAKKGAVEKDPRECEVCVKNLEAIDSLIPADKKRDKASIEAAISKHCTKSGFGSDWKPNPALTNQKDVKMCYYFDPIKKSISTPFSTGMPKSKVCTRLKKDNPEICEVKYRKYSNVKADKSVQACHITPNLISPFQLKLYCSFIETTKQP